MREAGMVMPDSHLQHPTTSAIFVYLAAVNTTRGGWTWIYTTLMVWCVGELEPSAPTYNAMISRFWGLFKQKAQCIPLFPHSKICSHRPLVRGQYVEQRVTQKIRTRGCHSQEIWQLTGAGRFQCVSDSHHRPKIWGELHVRQQNAIIPVQFLNGGEKSIEYTPVHGP